MTSLGGSPLARTRTADGLWTDARCAGLWTPDRFYGVAATGLWTAGYLERVIAGLTGGCAELMTHPGVLDASLRASRTRLKESRQAELDLLCGALPPLLARHGVTLRTFANPDA